MSGHTTIGYSEHVTAAELAQRQAIAKELGDVTVRVLNTSPEGTQVWVSRTAADPTGLTAYKQAVADEALTTFPAVTAPADLPPISEIPSVHIPEVPVVTKQH